MQIDNLVAGTYYASSVFVSSQGWVIFDGAGAIAGLDTTQILSALDGTWQNGTRTEYQSDYGYCAVQVKHNLK